MRKKLSLLFLCSIFYCFAANATITLSASTSTVTSGVPLTITASGENANLKINTVDGTNITISPGSAPVTAMLDAASYYNPPSVNATSFTVTFTNTSSACQSIPITISFTVDETIVSGGTTTTTTVPITVTQTITVNPTSGCVPVTYTGTASGVFYSTLCTTCHYPPAYTYTATATSTVSQAQANSLAAQNVTANGQAAANQNGSCALLPSPVLTVVPGAIPDPVITVAFTINDPSPIPAPTSYLLTITNTTTSNQMTIQTASSPFVMHGIIPGDVYTVTVTPVGTHYGTCNVSNTVTLTIPFFNVQEAGSFNKNCNSSLYVGSTVVYTVPAGKYSSTVSQAAANALAIADVNANGQNYANANGECDTPPVYVSWSWTGGSNGLFALCPNGAPLTMTVNYTGTITNYNWSYSGTGLVVVSGGTPTSNFITVKAVTGFTGGMMMCYPSNNNARNNYTQETPFLYCN